MRELSQAATKVLEQQKIASLVRLSAYLIKENNDYQNLNLYPSNSVFFCQISFDRVMSFHLLQKINYFSSLPIHTFYQIRSSLLLRKSDFYEKILFLKEIKLMVNVCSRLFILIGIPF